MHPYIHSSTSHNSQDMETTWIAIDRWAGKEDVVCTYVYIIEYYSAMKRMNATCSNMYATRDY